MGDNVVGSRRESVRETQSTILGIAFRTAFTSMTLVWGICFMLFLPAITAEDVPFAEMADDIVPEEHLPLFPSAPPKGGWPILGRPGVRDSEAITEKVHTMPEGTMMRGTTMIGIDIPALTGQGL